MELWHLVIMFVGLLLIRMPIAFAMIAVEALFLYVEGVPLTLLVQRIAGGLDSFPLLAVPLFLLAGALMNAMGVTDRIFSFASAIVRHVPGGLGHVNVLASVIFAGMSGSIIADAGGLGKVEIRAMKNAGYEKGYSAAITAASAIIGPIIPPSIVMVIYAFLTDVSVGRLFLAGLLPGLLLAGTMMVTVFVLAVRQPRHFPTMKRASRSEVWTSFRRAVLPLLAPIILVGGIVSGLFTPTESGVVAVLYVLVIGVFYLEFDLRAIPGALEETVAITCSTLFILASAAIFSWIVTTQNFPEAFAALFEGWIGSPFAVSPALRAHARFGSWLVVRRRRWHRTWRQHGRQQRACHSVRQCSAIAVPTRHNRIFGRRIHKVRIGRTGHRVPMPSAEPCRLLSSTEV